MSEENIAENGPLDDVYMTYDQALMMERFKAGYCKIPDNLEELPKLSLPNHRFMAPRTVDLRDYCTPPSNQGNAPHCAGHAAAAFAENILWRKNDYYEDIDPDMIYYAAKRIDGMGGGLEDGTTLTAVLQVLIDKGYFEKGRCEVQTITRGSDFLENVKFAIHKMGCMLVGLNISDEFYSVNAGKTSVVKVGRPKVGGHAMLCCGYNADGVIVLNSWGEEWGGFGFALVGWTAFAEQFLYGAVISNCLDGMSVRT